MTTTTGDAGTPVPPVAPPEAPPSFPPTSPFTAERPRASWGRRVLAVLLDSAIVAAVVWFATSAEVGLATLPMFGTDDPPLDDAAMHWTWGSCLALLALQAYTGMTPGKRFASIAVVDAATGRPVGLIRTVLRSLAHFLDAILMIGYLRPAWHPQGRTFADSLLDTVVVRSTRPVPHRWVEALQRRRRARAWGPLWPHWVTGGLAGLLCVAAAATWFVQGSGGGSGATETVTCRDGAATAYVETTAMTSWESRLGIQRETQYWRVVAAWTVAPDRLDGLDEGSTETTLYVRSPDGQELGATAGVELGNASTWWLTDDVDQVGYTAGVDVPQSVTGWTAEVLLVSEMADVLGECTVTLPAVAQPTLSGL